MIILYLHCRDEKFAHTFSEQRRSADKVRTHLYYLILQGDSFLKKMYLRIIQNYRKYSLIREIILILSSMKSVSIVYKRSRTTKDLSQERQKPPQIRRAVDQYFNKLVEKGNNKDEIIETIRSRTARASRLADRKKVFSSLNIASITPPPPFQSTLKLNVEKKMSKSPLLSIKRPNKQNFFSLNIPDADQNPQKNLFPHKKIKESNRHAKLKILQKPKCTKQATIILSVDFVFNEFNFWGEENIDETCPKIWKTLSSLINIVWIVRRESTFRKLLYFAQSNSLKIDGCVQIEPNKKQSLTVSYFNLQQEMKVPRTHKLVIINTVRNESKINLSQQDFRYALPVLNHPSTFVHIAPIDINQKSRLGLVKKILSKGLPHPFPLTSIFEEHLEKKGKLKNISQNPNLFNTEDETEQCPPINVLEEIETMKQKFLKFFGQNIGLTTKLQNGDSINFLIGDMLRRNYQIAKAYFNYCQQVSSWKEDCHISKLQDRLNSKYNKMEYNQKVYVWDFS